MRQYVDFGGVGTAVECFYTDADIFGRFFSVLDEDIEVSVVIKDACIQQFVLRLRSPSATFVDQLPVGKLPLRVLIEHVHVTVSGQIVKVEPVLFHIFAMIGLVGGETEHALFENGVAAVPKWQGENQQLIATTE